MNYSCVGPSKFHCNATDSDKNGTQWVWGFWMFLRDLSVGAECRKGWSRIRQVTVESASAKLADTGALFDPREEFRAPKSWIDTYAGTPWKRKSFDNKMNHFQPGLVFSRNSWSSYWSRLRQTLCNFVMCCSASVFGEVPSMPRIYGGSLCTKAKISVIGMALCTSEDPTSHRRILRGCGVWNSRSWTVSARRQISLKLLIYCEDVRISETFQRHLDTSEDAYLLSTLKRSMHKAGTNLSFSRCDIPRWRGHLRTFLSLGFQSAQRISRTWKSNCSLLAESWRPAPSYAGHRWRWVSCFSLAKRRTRRMLDLS